MVQYADNGARNDADKTVVTPMEATQSVQTGAMRYVLGISLALAVIVGIFLFKFYGFHIL